MKAPLLVWILLVIGGVVLFAGAAVVFWVADEDRDEALHIAKTEQVQVEAELRALATELVAQSGDIARGLSEGARQRLKDWLEQEPLALYRDAGDPTALDVEKLTNALISEVRTRSARERERVALLVERLALRSDERIAEVVAAHRAAASARNEDAAVRRNRALLLRLVALLLGLAGVLLLLIGVLVVRPLHRAQAAVNRIAGGDLAEPVPQQTAGARELVTLSRDVERMRQQIRAATENLEEQVAAKTQSLEKALDERTRALDDLRATQDRLVQSAKMAGIGTLAGGVAHEFNNMLGGILGCLESARHGTTDAGVLEDLAVADRTAQRASVLVRALLDVARPGQRTLKPVDLAQVVDDVLRAAGPSIERGRVTLEREGTRPEAVVGDAGQLHQVVLNLVTNALQAVDEGARIVVATGVRDGGQAFVEVRDSGPGVPIEDRARIFEPFFTSREDGTGLGLFVSYGIVERHGGRIEVGDAPEGGAKVTVSLPVASG